jgi:hypothetical protein
VARLIPLEFELRHGYLQTAAGILVPITLVHGDQQVELKARLDTGASDCLFDAHYADLLGIDVQSGAEKTLFFYESSNPANAFVGRRGWLAQVRLGLVH